MLITVIGLAMFPVSIDIGLLAALAKFGIYIVCGINGNGWWENNLLSRGYGFQETVYAANSESAMDEYSKG
ncbi:hypothetical protein [Halomonas sp.]|uniref:hypothetical protein n=1 Tax=Halomonas sp. TaxID=1486246 RepID=UPI003A95894A